MADMNLNDLLSNILHTDHKARDIEAAGLDHADIRGTRLTGKTTTASGYTYNDDTGIMTGKRVGTSGTAIGQQLDAYDSFKTMMEEHGGEGTFKKLAESEQKAIAKQAKNVYLDAAKGAELHDAAIAASHEQERKIMEQIGKKVTAERKALEAAVKAAPAADRARIMSEGMENISANQTAAIEKMKEHFGDLREVHLEHKQGLQKIVGEVERQTGINAAEHMSSKAIGAVGSAAAQAEKGMMSASTYEGLSGFGKMKAGIGANWKQAGTMGKFARVAGTGAGAIIGGYGLKDLGQVVGVVSPDQDEQGKEIPADSGKLFKAVAELGAAAGLMYLSLVKGGKAAAITR